MQGIVVVVADVSGLFERSVGLFSVFATGADGPRISLMLPSFDT